MYLPDDGFLKSWNIVVSTTWTYKCNFIKLSCCDGLSKEVNMISVSGFNFCSLDEASSRHVLHSTKILVFIRIGMAVFST
jgi:hypothetical protein